jgi:hypothetical protein
VLSSEALEIPRNFPETPEKCLEYLEILNLTSSFGDSGVSEGFSGDSGT